MRVAHNLAHGEGMAEAAQSTVSPHDQAHGVGSRRFENGADRGRAVEVRADAGAPGVNTRAEGDAHHGPEIAQVLLLRLTQGEASADQARPARQRRCTRRRSATHSAGATRILAGERSSSGLVEPRRAHDVPTHLSHAKVASRRGASISLVMSTRPASQSSVHTGSLLALRSMGSESPPVRQFTDPGVVRRRGRPS